MKLKHKRKLHNLQRLHKSLRRSLANLFCTSFNISFVDGAVRWFGMDQVQKAQADLLISKMKLVSKRIKK